MPTWSGFGTQSSSTFSVAGAADVPLALEESVVLGVLLLLQPAAISATPVSTASTASLRLRLDRSIPRPFIRPARGSHAPLPTPSPSMPYVAFPFGAHGTKI